MADDRERNQGMQQGGKDVAGGGQNAPGKNPQDDRSAGGGQQGGNQPGGGQQNQPGQAGGQKEGGQNEETRQ
jgi:hypothetical protein